MSDDTFPIVIGTVEKNSREKIRVAIDSYKSHTYLDVRIFADTEEGPRATKQGVTLKLDRISDLRGLIEAAEVTLKQRGLI